MKICLVTARRDPYISPIDYDGGANHVFHYASTLAQMGHSVTVITQLEKNKTGYNVEKALAQINSGGKTVQISANLMLQRLPFKASKNYDSTSDMKYVEEALTFGISLDKFFRNNKFDIYHYFHLFSISGLHINNNIPNIEKTIFSPLLPSLGRTYEDCLETRLSLEKSIYEHIPYIAYCSESEKNILKKYYNLNDTKLIKAAPGVDISLFNPNHNKKVTNDNLTICYPSNIRPQKRQHDLVNIIKYFQKQGNVKKIKCVCVGKTGDKKYLNYLINQLELNYINYEILEENAPIEKVINSNKQFVLIDGYSHSNLSALLKITDITIFPSKDETFGMGLLESLACGCVSVCYNLEAYNEYIKPGINVKTVPINKGINYFNEVLNSIIKNPNNLETLSFEAAKTALNYTWEKAAINLLKSYQNIIK